MSKKVLIVTPETTLLGGVANFYFVLRPYLDSDITYFVIHTNCQSRIVRIIFYCLDLMRFFCTLLFFKVKTVVLNPSLHRNELIRSGSLAYISKFVFRRMLLVHWRGWVVENEGILEDKRLSFFSRSLFRADRMVVLAKSIKTSLVRLGYPPSQIYFSTTVIDDSLPSYQKNYSAKDVYTVLFLSRITIMKGILIALDCLEILIKKYNLPVRLVIAGTGPDMPIAQEYASNKEIERVKFIGRVVGDTKVQILLESDVFLIPSYSEGMPNALLEAMGVGTPIVTSNVGGIPDFFENGKMGFIVNTFDPMDYANAIFQIIRDPDLIRRMGNYNRRYASDHFVATKVASRLHEIIDDL